MKERTCFSHTEFADHDYDSQNDFLWINLMTSYFNERLMNSRIKFKSWLILLNSSSVLKSKTACNRRNNEDKIGLESDGW